MERSGACNNSGEHTEYIYRIPEWRGEPFMDYYRHLDMKMSALTEEQAFISILMPLSPGHVRTCTLAGVVSNLALCAFDVCCS